jgi:hypothetical protein
LDSTPETAVHVMIFFPVIAAKTDSSAKTKFTGHQFIDYGFCLSV